MIGCMGSIKVIVSLLTIFFSDYPLLSLFVVFFLFFFAFLLAKRSHQEQ